MFLLFIYGLMFLSFRWVRMLTMILSALLVVVGVLALAVTADVSHHAVYR